MNQSPVQTPGPDVMGAHDAMRLDATLTMVGLVVRDTGRGLRMLDVGCGAGIILEGVSRHYPGLRLIGMDVSDRAVAAARTRVKDAWFVVAEGRFPPFLRGCFDLVLLTNVLEHVPDPVSLLRAVSAVMAPGGFLILSTPSRYRYDNLLRIARGRPPAMMSPDHVTEYSLGQVEELLDRSGFRVLRAIGRSRVPDRRTVRNAMSRFLAIPILNGVLRLLGSHHVLETTAFFLARLDAPPDNRHGAETQQV
jgi:SAM-dependent methyltransferase